MLTQSTRSAVENDLRESLGDQTETTFRWLGRNTTADFVVRLGLYAAAGLVLFRLITYVFSHADPMAGELLEARKDDTWQWWQTVGAVTWPIGVLIVIAGLCVALGLFVHTRSARDFDRAQEGVSRLRRDATGVPRARALTQVLEESVQNARRAFTLQLWLSRTLFIFGISLLGAFVLNSVITQSVTLLSGIFGIGAVGSIITAAVSQPGGRVGKHLSDITQLQLISITAMRQLTLLEEHVYRRLEHTDGEIDANDAAVTSAVNQMTEIAESAASKIEQYTEPAAKA